MHEPANGVVDSFGRRECLVTAFVANDPQSSREQTGPETVQSPERDAGSGVQRRVGKTELFWGDERACELGRLEETVDDSVVPDTGDQSTRATPA